MEKLLENSPGADFSIPSDPALVMLVNAQHIKRCLGAKLTDVKMLQWL